MPDGTITGANFVKTPDYVQVTGKSLIPQPSILIADSLLFIKVLVI
jgi:hypothetical protein